MGKKIRKWVCIALAVVMMASALPLIAGAIAPSAGGSMESASSGGEGPLKVEIKSNKDRYTLLGKMEFTATITNTSSSTVENISTQALLGASLRPLTGSQFTATKASLAPSQSFSFTYYADLNGLKGLDNLLLPLFWVSSLFHGGKADIGNGNGGAGYIEKSISVGLLSLFNGQYDASTMVKVWYGETIIDSDPQKSWDSYENFQKDIFEVVKNTNGSNNDKVMAVKIYLDECIENKTIQRYTSNDGGLYIILDTGMPTGVFWDDLFGLRPSPSRQLVFNQAIAHSTQLVAQSSNEKLNIATLQPLRTDPQFDTTIFDDAAQNVVQVNSNYAFSTNLDNMDVTIEALRNLSDNRIIMLNTHGNMFDGQYGFEIGIIPTTEQVLNDYSADVFAKTPRIIPFTSSYVITTAFFEEHYEDNSFDNTLLMLATCHGANTSEFSDVMRRKGVATVLAYSNSVISSYSKKMSETIFQELVKGYTVEQAVNTAKSIHGNDDSNFGDRLTAFIASTPTFRLLGDWYDHMIPAILNLSGDKEWSLNKEYYSNIYGEYVATVIDAETNTPLAGVNVKAINAKSEVVYELVATTEAGKVSCLLPEGEYTIVFSKEGYRTASFSETILRDESLIYDAVWLSRLGTPQGTITGKVVEQGTNAPLAGVVVEASKAGSTAIVSATTNASGQYSLTLDLNTTYNLKFTKSGFVEQSRGNVSLASASMALDDVAMVSTPFGGGVGTVQNPYEISTPRHLDNVRTNLSAYYKLTDDIDLANWGNWNPIGTNASNPFTGVLDGNGYVIRNMTISINANTSSAVNAGLFGYLSRATIKNVGIVNSTVGVTNSGGAFAGAISGFSYNGCTLTNCYNTGNITATSVVEYAYSGGIVGSSSSPFSYCYNTGVISATSNSGEAAYAGGIVGFSSHTTGISSPFSLAYCYNIGSVTASSGKMAQAGGIAGSSPTKGVINNCYFLNTSASRAVGNNGGTLESVNALTSTQMKQQTSFVGFDFTNTWAINPAINNGYPYLRGMQP